MHGSILLIIVSICICVNFRNLTRLRYICMDAVQHYKAAREFSENTTLFDKAVENSSTSKSHMPMGYVNIGILFKIFRPLIGVVSLYKIYILFEAVIFFLCAMMFYYLIEKICKTRNQLIIGIIFTLVFLIGYPLNGLISGFHYLIIGILYFITIIYVMKEFIIKEDVKFIYKVIILTLLNIGLIFSYALFCPPIYLAEFIYFISKYKKDKNKKHISIFTLVSLILTGLMGCDIILYQRFVEIGATGIALEGWIYKNDWSNIILFIPFVIYYIIKFIKKEDVFEKSLLISFMIFIITIAVGKSVGVCSSYYFYKNSYILWVLILYIMIKGMVDLLNKKDLYKYIVNVFATMYVFFLMISILFVNTYIKTEGKTNETILTSMEIFSLNATNMKVNASFVSKEELEAFQKMDDIIENKWKEKDYLLVFPSHTQMLWAKALTGHTGIDNYDIKQDINKWNNNEYKYLMLLKKRKPYEIVKERLNLENTKIVFENEGATIFVRNGE